MGHVLFWFEVTSPITKNIHVHPCESQAHFISSLSVSENFYIIATIDSLLLNNLSGAMSKYLSNERTFIPFQICTFSSLT